MTGGCKDLTQELGVKLKFSREYQLITTGPSLHPRAGFLTGPMRPGGRTGWCRQEGLGCFCRCSPLSWSESLRPADPLVSQVEFKDPRMGTPARGGMRLITLHSSNTATQAKALSTGKMGALYPTGKQMAPICLSVSLSFRFPNLWVPKLQGARSVLRLERVSSSLRMVGGGWGGTSSLWSPDFQSPLSSAPPCY